MGLMGTGRPKMVINIGTTQDEVELYNWVTTKDEEEIDIHSAKAPRTGKRKFVISGKHWTFAGKIFLYKYNDPEAAYNEFKSYEGETVYLYRHNDGFPFFDEDSNPCLFQLVSVNEAYTDQTNKYDVLNLTFKSLKRIRTNLSPVLPSDIEDLVLWFAQDTLENPSSNNFIWTDKVAGVKSLQGNYGTGDGVVQINGKTFLHSTGDMGSTNQLNGGGILNYPEFTFIGLFQKDLPQGTEFYNCHIFEQQNITPHYVFGFGASNFGGLGSDGLKFRAQDGFSSNVVLGISGSSGGAEASTPPHKLTLAVVRIKYGDSINLIINGSQYDGAFLSSNQYIMVNYILNKNWEGLLGEFMFYSRALTDAEINYLALKFKQEYLVDWTNI